MGEDSIDTLEQRMTNNIPLIYTIDGNLPIADLEYATRWEGDQEAGWIKLVETYSRAGRVVRESAHVYHWKGVEIPLQAGSIN